MSHKQQTNNSDSVSCECPEGKDDMYHCEKCDACCFGWGLYKDKYADYMDRGLCMECAMKDGMTLEEAVYLTNG